MKESASNSSGLVSVVIPVYNAEKYLEYTVDSILQQPVPVAQIILVDDGSTDSSPVICDRLVQTDQRIRVLHQRNSGVSAARNNGMAEADGTYVAFCDADDAWATDFYDRGVEELLGRGYDILGFQYHIGDHALENLQWMGCGESDAVVSGGPDAIWAHGNRHLGCMFFRRDFLHRKEIRFPVGLKYNEDEIFKSCAECLSKQMFYCEKPMYLYRLHSASAVHNLDANIMERYQTWMNAWRQMDTWLWDRHRIKTTFGMKYAQLYFVEMCVVCTQSLHNLKKLDQLIDAHIRTEEFSVLTKENCAPHLRRDLALLCKSRALFYLKHITIGLLHRSKRVLAEIILPKGDRNNV